jgi:hypothetical protein
MLFNHQQGLLRRLLKYFGKLLLSDIKTQSRIKYSKILTMKKNATA